MRRSDQVRRVLVLFWHPDPTSIRSAIRQHLEMLGAGDVRHEVWYCNTFGPTPARIRQQPFDAVILHTTLLCMRWSHLFSLIKWRLRWVADLDCLKIAFPQDEYDHSEILDEWLYEWGVNTIFSNFDEPERRLFYPLMRDRANFHKALTGYVDEGAATVASGRILPTAKRQVDVVYRASHLPYWFGSQGQLKHRVGLEVAERARSFGLRTDISTREEDTIVGDKWLEFLASGKCVVGCESGSSVLDRRGEVRSAIQWMLRGEPSLTFEQVSQRMGPGWDDHTFFAISPRHFEAVITRTCQILVEGCYDGILIPERHYIPLRRDFSNLDEVLEKVRDDDHVQEIADRAYEEVYLKGKHTYRELSERLTEILTHRARNKSQLVASTAKQLGLMTESINPPGPTSQFIKGLLVLYLALSDGTLRRILAAWASNRELRRRVSGRVIAEDLLKVGLIRRAQSGRQNAGPPFSVDVEMDGPDIRLISQRTTQGEPALPGRVQRINSIQWDHSAIGDAVLFRLTKRRAVRLQLLRGQHRFRALEAIAELRPELVADAVLLLPKPGLGWTRVWRNPLNYFFKGYGAVSVSLRDPALRAVLAHARRASIEFDRALEDNLKLALARGHTTFSVSTQIDGHVLRLVSCAPGESVHSLSMAEARKLIYSAEFAGVEWDHSKVGLSLTHRALGHSIIVCLSDGRHRFETLTAVAQRDPEVVLDALSPLLLASTDFDLQPEPIGTSTASSALKPVSGVTLN